MTSFVFDVDNTLTPSRQHIDSDFLKYMLDFTRIHTCYICTGSDRTKTLEQLGDELTNSFTKAFHCSGNHIFEKSQEIYKSDWQLNGEEYWFLESKLNSINYFEKTGNHIEQRIGTANFSVCGRNATTQQRENYVAWESRNKVRPKIAAEFNQWFGHRSVAVIGGDVSIDIFKIGNDKSQIRKMISDTVVYFGDKCLPGGNDYEISKLCETVHQIDHGWKQTFEILKNQY
jgi:phosphomannomutase